jgi:hypothetical protein
VEGFELDSSVSGEGPVTDDDDGCVTKKKVTESCHISNTENTQVTYLVSVMHFACSARISYQCQNDTAHFHKC